MTLLLRFEQPMAIRRKESAAAAAAAADDFDASSGGTTTRLVRSSVLSSAALRLLQEFALRYGVGDPFARLVYLEYLVNDFEPVSPQGTGLPCGDGKPDFSFFPGFVIKDNNNR